MKKNLLKALTLTAMLALSVGAMTGCDDLNGKDGVDGKDGINGKDGKDGKDGEKGAKGDAGEKGEKGDKGATGDKGAKGDTGAKGDKGETGAQGEKGEKGETGATGEAGKDGQTPYIGENGHWFIGEEDTNIVAKGDSGTTYYPIIVLADPINVKITVDDNKCFVEHGESFTVRFTTTEKDFEMVKTLRVNNKIVEVPVGQLYWTHTATVDERGWLIQDVSFGTVAEYAKEIIRSRFNEIYAGDVEVALIKEDAFEINPRGTSSYKDTTLATQALADIAAATAEFDKPETRALTPEQKVEKARTLLAGYENNWASMYRGLLSGAKQSATQFASNALYGANIAQDPTGRALMADADRLTMLNLVKADLAAESVDTLREIADILDSGLKTGKYYELEQARASLLNALELAYNETVLVDEGFRYNVADAKYSKEIATLIADYNLNEDVLPYGIFMKYVAQVSKIQNKAELVEQIVTSAKAELSVAIANARETIGNNILEAYRQEIYASTKIDEAQKLSAYVAVKSNLQDWIGNSANLTSMMGSYAYPAVGAKGLLGSIENLLDTPNNTAGITEAFIAERKAVSLEKANAQVEAATLRVLSKDARYRELCELKADGSVKIDSFKVSNTVIDNFVGKSSDLNVNIIANNGKLSLDANKAKVGQLKETLATVLSELDVYQEALNQFATKVSSQVIEAEYTSKVNSYTFDYVTTAVNAYNAKIFKSTGIAKDGVSFTTVEVESAKFAGLATLVKTLEDAVAAYEPLKDNHYKTTVWPTSDMYKGIYEGATCLAKGIFDGTTTAASIGAYFKAGAQKYASDVAEYLKLRLVDLQEVRSGAIAEDGILNGGVNTDAIWAAYDAAVQASVGLKSYDAIFAWYTQSCQNIKAAYQK